MPSTVSVALLSAVLLAKWASYYCAPIEIIFEVFFISCAASSLLF